MDEYTGALGIVEEMNVAVPMRDGIVLRANVFRPDGPGRSPAIVIRTPYGKAGAPPRNFMHAGYAVISQDTRGRYASDGEFKVLSEGHTGDAEDGYDTIEWVAAQPWCNGKVGTMGASYLAWMQWHQARLRPPHLVAMSAVSIPVELTALDWPGVFKPARRVHWWLNTIGPDLRRRANGLGPHTPAEARTVWSEIEQAQRLYTVPWIEICRCLPEPLASQAESWLREPARRAWRFDEAHAEIDVPNLDFTGWYDHCCSLAHLPGMQHRGRTELARTQSKVVVGPWFHCGLGARQCGEIDFGPAAQVDTAAMQIRWFDHWLKGLDNGVDTEPPVRYFVIGSAQWKSAATWPPAGGVATDWFLSGDGGAGRPDGSGRLSPAPRGLPRAPGDDACDTYVYDPHNPCPTLWSPALFYTASDRRKLEYRPDILYYCTPPLEDEIEIAGNPEVVLWAASSAPDTDFFARLVDEDPAGPALEICFGLVRARHRHGLDREELLTPGEATEFRIALGPTACRFRKGHRIRLEITSSDFPNHDRNHNTGRNDLLDAEMVTAEQRIFHTADYPSRLVLPVISR